MFHLLHLVGYIRFLEFMQVYIHQESKTLSEILSRNEDNVASSAPLGSLPH